ncbi:sensor histidine kinase [Pseudanabaena mucicola]|uniref:histidine kinase n=1 Tax=Pseudanabaena mucicola FACHB-723 TaxID=2692860 RepID=A0ABR7ZZE4_9CYAN|nr:HAMP domain-containing sensor histidine kinase [Pseudanabaena mucicola]MBD2189247.1 HAMP domain-containing histidine kinase [Pseudanabaena mucicola FACHB-723]
MAKPNLRTRLLFSHLLVVVLSMVIVTLSGVSINPLLFDRRIQEMRNQGLLDIDSKTEKKLIIGEFHSSWGRSMSISLALGALGSLGLSYLVARRIRTPLQQITSVTQEFREGNFKVRMPNSEIPEIDYLSQSFNVMANGLEDSEQKRSELISDMTHELRTPLTVTRGYLERLLEGKTQPSPELYQDLIKENRRLERLVNNLQELSKAQAGTIPLKPTAIAIKPLLTTLVERFAEQVSEDLSLELDYQSSIETVITDHDCLEQILVNLIGNAIQYTEAGKITIRTYDDDCDRIWIEVQDSGIGIAIEDLPYVFKRFWRADKARSRRSGGTGIGLAITQSLVELLGGKIEVTSQLQVGSIFRFCLQR